MDDKPNNTGRARGGLIDRLVGELREVKPLSLTRLYLVCFTSQVAVGVAGAWYLGVRSDLIQRLDEPSFVIILASLTLSAAACTIVAARSAVPGRGVKRAVSAVLVFVPLVLAGSVALASPWGGVWQGWATLIDGGYMCMQRITMLAVMPWIVMLLILRRAAPLREYATGMFIGLASFLVGGVVVELACDVTDHNHLALAHYMPVAVGAVVVAMVSASSLRSPSIQARRDSRA